VRCRHRTVPWHLELKQLLEETGRPPIAGKQLDFLQSAAGHDAKIYLYYAGDLLLLKRPAVSIVGTRDVTADGAARARKLSSELAAAGVLIVSGLAKGVDTAAHTAAIEAGGATAAVIGTPVDKAYPVENILLQELIYREYLLLSPFGAGERVYRSNFPKRNRVMAAITDATVIVEASNSSGALHQAAEFQRLGSPGSRNSRKNHPRSAITAGHDRPLCPASRDASWPLRQHLPAGYWHSSGHGIPFARAPIA
jgi:DNA protecting protein DprA